MALDNACVSQVLRVKRANFPIVSRVMAEEESRRTDIVSVSPISRVMVVASVPPIISLRKPVPIFVWLRKLVRVMEHAMPRGSVCVMNPSQALPALIASQISMDQPVPTVLPSQLVMVVVCVAMMCFVCVIPVLRTQTVASVMRVILEPIVSDVIVALKARVSMGKPELVVRVNPPSVATARLAISRL